MALQVLAVIVLVFVPGALTQSTEVLNISKPEVLKQEDGFVRTADIAIPKNSEGSYQKPKLSGADIINQLFGREPSSAPTISPTPAPTTMSPTSTNLFTAAPTTLNSDPSSDPGLSGITPISGCEDKTHCDAGICLCLTAGTEIGFMNNELSAFKALEKSIDEAKVEKLRNDRNHYKFTHLFMPLLPGCDDIKFRKLWEFVTSLVSESYMDKEDGSELNGRTGAYARKCGGLSEEGVSAHEDTELCQEVRRSSGDEPALVTALQDMTKDSSRIASKIEASTLAVFMVRNPVDQFQSYLKQKQATASQTGGEAASVMAAEMEAGSAVAAARKLLKSKDKDKNKKVTVEAQEPVKSKKRKGKDKEDTPAATIPEVEVAARGGEDGVVVESPIPSSAASEADVAAFSDWFNTQWVPYAQSIATYSKKQRYIFKYEELKEDASGIFYDFLLSTGVGQQLGIGKRVLSALAHKSLRKHDRPLIALDTTSEGFAASGGLSLIPTLKTYEGLLRSLGYFFYEQALPVSSYPSDLEQTVFKENELRDIKTHIAIAVGGEITDSEDLVRAVEGKMSLATIFWSCFAVFVLFLSVGGGSCFYLRSKAKAEEEAALALSTSKSKAEKLKAMDIKGMVASSSLSRSLVKVSSDKQLM